MKATQATLPAAQESAIQEIYSHEDTVLTIKTGEQVWIAIKPISEKLGLEWANQFRALKRDPVLAEGIVVMTIPSSGGPQETITLPLEYLNGWLFKVNAARYKSDDPRREVIIRYQKECYRVLFEHFHPGCATNTRLEDRQNIPNLDLHLWLRMQKTVVGKLFPDKGTMGDRSMVVIPVNVWNALIAVYQSLTPGTGQRKAGTAALPERGDNLLKYGMKDGGIFYFVYAERLADALGVSYYSLLAGLREDEGDFIEKEEGVFEGFYRLKPKYLPVAIITGKGLRKLFKRCAW